MLLGLGCSTGAALSPTPPPTPTLIPATPTPTSTPPTPTATIPPRTNPDDLQSTPAATIAAVRVPAVVQGLVSQAVDDLADSLGVARSAVTVVALEEAVWRSLDYGCSEERLPGLGEIEIPGYRVVLQVDGTTYAYHTDTEATVRRCDGPETIVGQTQTLLEVDPVAAELALLAQRRAASVFDVPADEVEVVSVRAYRWPDASLGCPLPGETYTPVQIDGYRIVVADISGSQLAFHTNFEQLRPCDPGDEVLPTP
jgi:hypothetical protein